MNPQPASTPQHPLPAGNVSDAVEHLFRHEAGRIVATLTGIFGLEHLALAEDVVQEALARALQTWPYRGVPDNPAAWIMRAARNLALDQVRREHNFRDKLPEIVWTLEVGMPAATTQAEGGNEIEDDRLRMLFVCCHPLIQTEAQVALALKILGGFSPAEIAAGFLTTEAAIAKRLTRARAKIREAGIPFTIPEGEELARRLDGVLHSLYLLFNEGYKTSSGGSLVRADVCHEAIRLAALLARHPAGDQPRTHALLALMHLNAARLPGRVDAAGALLRLQEQDRSRWDAGQIARGMFHLAQSAAGREIGTFHLQAGIAACHCAAPDYAATDWPQILELYDQLATLDDSPVVALNRAVALAEVRGPQAGLDAIERIRGRRSLDSYYLLHAAVGEFELRLNRYKSAATHFRRALRLAVSTSEKDFLGKRLAQSEPHSPQASAIAQAVH